MDVEAISHDDDDDDDHDDERNMLCSHFYHDHISIYMYIFYCLFLCEEE